MLTRACNTIVRTLTETGTLNKINCQLFKDKNYAVFKSTPNVRSLYLTTKLCSGAPASNDPCAPKDVYKVSPLCPSKGYEYKKKPNSLKCPKKGCPSLKKPEAKPPEPPKKDEKGDCKKEEKPKPDGKDAKKKAKPKDSGKDKSSLGKDILAACFKNKKKDETPKKAAPPPKPVEPPPKKVEPPPKKAESPPKKAESPPKKEEPKKAESPPNKEEPKKAEPNKVDKKSCPALFKKVKKPCPTPEEKQCARKELKGCEKEEGIPTCGVPIDECSKVVPKPVSPEVKPRPKKERPPYKIVCPPSNPNKGKSCVQKKCCEKQPEEERCCSVRPWPFSLLEKRCNKPPKKPCLEKPCKKPNPHCSQKIVPVSSNLLESILSMLLDTRMKFHSTSSLEVTRPICQPKKLPPCSGDIKISEATQELMLQLRQIARENRKKQPESCLKEEEPEPCLVPKDGGWKQSQEFVLMRDPEKRRIYLGKMTVKHHEVEGFDNAKNLINDLESRNEVIFVLFSGAKGESGASWCPDCEKAEPVIDKFLNEKKFNNDFNFIHVGIERPVWKDMSCQYRTDPKFKLERIPTLIKWGGPEKLKEAECANKEMLDLLFEDA